MARRTNELRQRQAEVDGKRVRSPIQSRAQVDRTRLDAVSVLGLQRSAGNASVAGLLARSKTKTKATTSVHDQAKGLAKASLEDLFDLYMIDDDVDMHFLSDDVSFSGTWVRGEGDEQIKAAIQTRLEAMNRTEMPTVVSTIGKLGGNPQRRLWLLSAANKFMEYSSEGFLRLTNEVNTRIDLADRRARAWLASLATSYRRAWKSHRDVLTEQDDQNLFKEKLKLLPLQIVLGAGLAFIPGGVGGVIGSRMKKAGESDFMVDGIKDLWKWGLRSTGQAGIQGGIAVPATAPALKAYPLDPEQWEGKETERIAGELAQATTTLLDWQVKARTSDPSFALNFDPIESMELALRVSDDQGKKYEVAELEPVDHDKTADQFEKGFWAKWLELYGYQLELWRDWGWGTKEYVLERNVGLVVQRRCEKLGLDVERYAKLAQERIERQFPGDKHRGDFYFESDDG